MNKREQRITLAEYRGWKKDQRGHPVKDCWRDPRNQLDVWVIFDNLPDYVENLTALRELVEYTYATQPPGWAAKFEEILIELCSKRQYPHWFVWCAKAEDLAKALLISLGLWKT